MSCRTWEDNVNNQVDSQLFNRRVDVHRLKTVAGVTDAIGEVGYSGAEQSLTSIEGETVLFTNLPASVQLATAGRSTKNTALPGDAVSRPVWNIFIPASVVSLYDIRDRDIIVDDEHYRYEVGANYWVGTGYQLSTIRLEA